MGRLAPLALSILGLGFPAAAATLDLPGVASFQVSATCMETCDDAGMADGGQMDGRLDLSMAGFAPHAAFGASALQS